MSQINVNLRGITTHPMTEEKDVVNNKDDNFSKSYSNKINPFTIYE